MTTQLPDELVSTLLLLLVKNPVAGEPRLYPVEGILHNCMIRHIHGINIILTAGHVLYLRIMASISACIDNFYGMCGIDMEGVT